MIEYLSPAVLAAVLRVSSTPLFSTRLAMASLLALREISGSKARAAERRGTPHAVATQEEASRV